MINQVPQTDPARSGGDGDIAGMILGTLHFSLSGKRPLSQGSISAHLTKVGNEVIGESSSLVPKQRPTLNQSLLRPCGVQLWLEFRIHPLEDGGKGRCTTPFVCEGNQEWGNPSSGYLYGSGPCCRSASNETPVVGAVRAAAPCGQGVCWWRVVLGRHSLAVAAALCAGLPVLLCHSQCKASLCSLLCISRLQLEIKPHTKPHVGLLQTGLRGASGLEKASAF